MEQISWDKFELKGESKQKSFEDLCMFLCCRELKIAKINSYQNQPGIETEPFEANGKKYGFQAKYFDSNIKWQQIENSICIALDNYTELNKIFIYSNKEQTKKGSKKTRPELNLEKKANKAKVELEYITHKDILLKLSQPQNLDLAQLYFGIGNELGFLNASVNPKHLTFIQSNEYLELPLIDKDNNEVIAKDKILSDPSKLFLILGNPGSGKSIFMHKLLQVFGGLDQIGKPKDVKGKIKPELSKMIAVLTKNNALPILINLKNCIKESIESIIRNRKIDNMVNGKELGFIYILDGLDELDEKNADFVLNQISEICHKDSTKKIIISCRTGSLNRLKAKTYFNDIIEYKIKGLNKDYILKYFKSLKNKHKIEQFKNLEESSISIIEDINDILLIKLLWDSIDELYEKSNIIDLFDLKIKLLFADPYHKKNIEDLMLLNPKVDKIISINQDISFEIQKKYKFVISQEELQDLILKKFERLDYDSVNDIVSYISNLFFENSTSYNSNTNAYFVYNHRRYQEYFLTQKLKYEYESDTLILRKLKIITNREYIEKMFLPYLRKIYTYENNLPGIVELNLFDVYLGKNDGFNIDENYSLNSPYFIEALASQDTNEFYKLLENENLNIKDNLLIDIEYLKREAQNLLNENDNYKFFKHGDILKNIWSRRLPILIKNIVIFHKYNKIDCSNLLKENYLNVSNLYTKQILDILNADVLNINDPRWEVFEDWIYFQIVIIENDLESFYKDNIKSKISSMEDRYLYNNTESEKEKLIKSFIRFCLAEKRVELYKIVERFDDYEMSALLDVFSTIEYLPSFFESAHIYDKVKKFLNNYPHEIKDKNISVLFFKKYFNIKLNSIQEDYLKKVKTSINNERMIDRRYNSSNKTMALVSFVLDEYSFEEYFSNTHNVSIKYYNELGVYSALYKDYISLLAREKSIEAIVRDYMRYINDFKEGTNFPKYFESDISTLWSYIIANAKDTENISNLINLVIKERFDIIPLTFYYKLNSLNANLSSKIIDHSILSDMITSYVNQDDDYQSLVNKCFQFSTLYATIDKDKSIYYFERGVTDSILRHGWRKDTIISYQLTESFEIILNNNWLDQKASFEFANEIFNLTMRVTQITDGKHTWKGPYLLIEMVAKVNIELAELFKNQLIKTDGNQNYNNIVVTSILNAKIKKGVKINEIEDGMNEFRIDYGYQAKPMADYYEQKFILYLKIANSFLYTDEEQIEAFDKAYEQILEMQKKEIEYYLSDDQFKLEIASFQILCDKYNIESPLKKGKLQNDNTAQKNKNYINVEQFIHEVEECNSSIQIEEKYIDLKNSDKQIKLNNYDSWRVLIDKTFEINGNISLLLDYFKDSHYPNSSIPFHHNSDNLHIPLAIALKASETRQESLEYIYKYSGYAGFRNLIEVYETLGDKDMCLKLFYRYIEFCKLLVF